MKRRIYFLALFFSILTSLLHVAGIEFSLYERISLFDVPMHFFAGTMVSLVLCGISLSIPDERKRIWVIIIGTFAVGILWEIFEYVTALELVREGYYFDTFTDVVIDGIGMLFGIYLKNRYTHTIEK